MCPNYTSSGLTNIGNILPHVWWQSNTPLLKTVTVMVVVVGAQKKDRFHLLRDLWEIMGGRLCPSFLEKKISVRSSYRVLLSTVPSPKKTQRTKKYNNIGFSSLPLPTLLKDSLMAWHSTWSARQCVYIWSDNLQLLYTSKLEVIWDQTTSNFHVYNLLHLPHITSNFLMVAMVIMVALFWPWWSWWKRWSGQDRTGQNI